MQETPVQFLGQEDLLKRDRLPTSVFLGFSDGSAGKESTCIVRDLSSIPRLERSPGEGNDRDMVVGWHHQLNEHGFGWTPGVADGQEGLTCCSSWGRRVRHD